MRRANVEGTVNVLESARDADVDRVVYTSTVSTIGIPEEGTLGDESTEPTQRTLHGHYKQSKFEAEQEALRLAEEGGAGGRGEPDRSGGGLGT